MYSIESITSLENVRFRVSKRLFFDDCIPNEHEMVWESKVKNTWIHQAF